MGAYMMVRTRAMQEHQMGSPQWTGGSRSGCNAGDQSINHSLAAGNLIGCECEWRWECAHVQSDEE